MDHLTLRVAWHDCKWTAPFATRRRGTATALGSNACESSATRFERIDSPAGSWSELTDEDLPPCIAEAGGFLNASDWTRTFRHPYARSQAARATHGHLRATSVRVPPFSTFAVPFWWMLRENQRTIDESLPSPLPPDEEPPFPSDFVFGRVRQEALLETFFPRLSPEKSLVFFYAKEGQPLGDWHPRLVVGVGRILTVGRLQRYEASAATRAIPSGIV